MHHHNVSNLITLITSVLIQQQGKRELFVSVTKQTALQRGKEDIKVSYSEQSHFHPVSQLSLSSNLFGGVMLITLLYLQWKLPSTFPFSLQRMLRCVTGHALL